MLFVLQAAKRHDYSSLTAGSGSSGTLVEQSVAAVAQQVQTLADAAVTRAQGVAVSAGEAAQGPAAAVGIDAPALARQAGTLAKDLGQQAGLQTSAMLEQYTGMNQDDLLFSPAMSAS